MKKPGYIYIVNWDRFQHYRDRDPRWIKMYRDLLHKDEYLRLSLADRGLLHDIWKLTAETGNGRTSADPQLIARLLNVRRVSLEPLIQAGFIKIRASKSAATLPVSVERDAGESRVSVARRSAESHPNVSRGSRRRRNHAGSDLLPASKALAPRYQDASPEGSKEPKRKNARERLAANSAAAARSEEPEPPRNGHINREGLATLSRAIGATT